MLSGTPGSCRLTSMPAVLRLPLCGGYSPAVAGTWGEKRRQISVRAVQIQITLSRLSIAIANKSEGVAMLGRNRRKGVLCLEM